MKLPDVFSLRVRTYELGKLGTYLSGRKSKDLIKKVPIELSFAKSRYNGGRYSTNNKYTVEILEEKNWEKKQTAVYLLFKKSHDKKA